MTELLRELEAVVRLQADFDNASGWEQEQTCGAREDISSVNFLRTHHAEIAEALRDARRYRWLRDNQFNQLVLSRNEDHAPNYMSAKDWIEEEPEWYADDPPEEVEKMKDSNVIWKLQIYPSTPIGFCKFNRSTMDAVIDAAIDAHNSAREVGE